MCVQFLQNRNIGIDYGGQLNECKKRNANATFKIFVSLKCLKKLPLIHAQNHFLFL